MAELKRDLNLPLLMLYGLGTILGAGIYVLTGVVAAHAGDQTPLAFFLAAVVAAPTAYTFAVLCGSPLLQLSRLQHMLRLLGNCQWRIERSLR